MNDTQSPLLTEEYTHEAAQDEAIRRIVEMIQKESQKITSIGIPSYKWNQRMLSQLYEIYGWQC